MRISDWSSDVCSSDLVLGRPAVLEGLDVEVRPGPLLEGAVAGGGCLAAAGLVVLADDDDPVPVAVNPGAGRAGGRPCGPVHAGEPLPEQDSTEARCAGQEVVSKGRCRGERVTE